MAPSIHIFVHYHKLNRMKGDTAEHLITHARTHMNPRVYGKSIQDMHAGMGMQAMRSRSSRI